MSLQVWLPLTKDLRQQGLSNVTVTNNGATFNSAGKLGGTYSATASGQTITINLSNLSTMLANGKTYSLACWARPTGTPTNGWVIKLGDNTCGLWWAKSAARWVWNENDNGKRCANETISSDYTNWHHLVITVDKTVSGKITTKQYVDGELADGYPGSTWDSSSHSQPTGTTITISPYVAQLNDIRLYDHCLSPMEVKELAKGLVLHYPLNRGGWGQENLIANSGSFSSINGWTNNQNTTLSVENNELKVVMNQTTSTPGVKSTNTIDLSAGTYVASLLIKVENGNKNYVNYPFYLATSGGTVAYSGAATKREERGEYIYEEATFTLTSAINGVIVYVLTSGPANGEIWHIKWVKLEEGSVATPWCPNSSDALATTMGLNGTTEYDCSGFCNNGTRTGTFTWTSDTPKYSVSQYFNGSSYSKTDSGTFSWFAFDKCTVAIWMKPTTLPSSWAGTFGIAHNNSSTNKSFVIGNYGGKFTVQSANGSWVNIQASDLPIDEWHHCVATLDDTTIKMYMDGELVKTYTINWGTTTVASDTRVQVGIDLPGSDEVYQGYYSDARIYATALSADDVKSLYQNSAYIDSSGNVYGKIHEI